MDHSDGVGDTEIIIHFRIKLLGARGAVNGDLRNIQCFHGTGNESTNPFETYSRFMNRRVRELQHGTVVRACQVVTKVQCWDSSEHFTD